MYRWCLAMIGCVILSGCERNAPPPMPAPQPSAAPAVQELMKTDIVVGTGEPIAQGQKAVVHYTGWLYEPDAPDQKGKQFDSSRTKGTPFRFSIGAAEVIQGWDQGVAGMQVGGQRRLIIPASLGYGERGAGMIPPNAPLLFEVELLAIE
jgi:FKBP-type peptidyl-prolyl cis-trans isomerase FkpA